MNLASGTDCVKPRAIDLERRLSYLMLHDRRVGLARVSRDRDTPFACAFDDLF